MTAVDRIDDAASLTVATDLQRRLVDFVRHARDNGYRVGVAEEVDAQRVLTVCGVQESIRLRWGLRALLCADERDWSRFDELFDAFWRPSNVSSRVQANPAAPVAAEQQPRSGIGGSGLSAGSLADAAGMGRGDPADARPEGVSEGASSAESLAATDFRFLADEAQQATVERLAVRLAQRMRRRLTRRQRAQRQGQRLHLRATVRQSLRYGGLPLTPIFRSRRRRPPRLLLIVDVSRSMSLYSQVFLRFAQGLVGAFRDAAAFAYHTRLVSITEALRQPDATRVRTSLKLISRGWSGGTRIGDCLQRFNDEYGRLLSSRSIVIVVSDGLDTGEPDVLARELQRVKRRCRRIIWLNPLLGRSGYQPRTRSMLAALPCIDLFAPAHNLESLAALEPELASF
jgi:uncharacterized protein with von Willebrand factor type A (vWA) domain